MAHFVAVVIVSVLVCLSGTQSAQKVAGRDNVDMVMGSVGVRRGGHIIEAGVIIKGKELGIWMCLLNFHHVISLPEVQRVDNMAHI